MFTSKKSENFDKRGQWLKNNPPVITVSAHGISFSFRDAGQAKRMEQRLAVMTANQVRQLHFEIYGNSTPTPKAMGEEA